MRSDHWFITELRETEKVFLQLQLQRATKRKVPHRYTNNLPNLSLNVLELEPLNSSGYLLASSMYALGGSFVDSARMRRLVKERGVMVVVGYNLVHVNNKACRLLAGDKSTSQLTFFFIPHGSHPTTNMVVNWKHKERIKKI